MKTLVTVLLVLAACAPMALAQDAIPLEKAVKDEKVEVVVTGTGASTGDAILITVRRKVPEVLHVTLTPGTVFKNVSGAVQNMVGASIKGERVGGNSYRPGAEIILMDNEKHEYVIEAYCLDFHKPNPRHSDSFTITSVDAQATRILEAGQNGAASIRVIQAALWMHRGRVSPVELKRRFPVSDADIATARRLLASVTNPVSQASDPNARQDKSKSQPPNQNRPAVQTWTDSQGVVSDKGIDSALVTGDVEAIMAFLEKRPGLVKAKNNDSQTPLHVAAKNGRKELAALLLDKGAEVNAKDRAEGTPLHWAVLHGDRGVIELLLARGAAANVGERRRWTPLHYAAWKGRKDLAELLLARGADVDAKQIEGMTPLHIAAMNDKKEVAELLISKGAKIDAKDNQGRTPLLYAAVKGYVETSILLHGHEAAKAHPALAALPPKPDIAERYKWKSHLPSSYTAPEYHTDAVVTEVIVKGTRYLAANSGRIMRIGDDIELDTPYSRVKIRIDPVVRETNYAGLCFKTPCTLNIGKDSTLLAAEEGIVAKDTRGTYWISRPATLNGKEVKVFFPVREVWLPQ